MDQGLFGDVGSGNRVMLSIISPDVEISACSLGYKDSDFDIYTGSAGFLFPAG